MWRLALGIVILVVVRVLYVYVSDREAAEDADWLERRDL